MSQAPVDRLESGTDTEKNDDETVREYVERIGRNNDVDPAVVENALTYITEWHYSETPPDDDDDSFRNFLDEVSDDSTVGDETPSHVEDGHSESSEVGNSGVDGANNESAGSSTPEEPVEAKNDQTAITTAETDDTSDRDMSTGSASGHQGEQEQRSPPATSESAVSEPGESSEQDTHDERIESAERLSTRATDDETTQGFKTGIQGKKPRKLLVRFVLIVATAPVIGSMLARAWVPGNVLYEEGRALLTRVLGLPGPAAVDLLAVFAGGLYLALLVLFAFDVKKRVQAVLLSLGTGLACGAVAVAGVFFPALALTPLNGFSFLLGFAAGLTLELQFERVLQVPVVTDTQQRGTGHLLYFEE